MSKHKKEKKLDAIAMKRRIQEKFYEDTKDLSPEELIAYIRQRIANSRFADFLSETDHPTEAVPADRKS